MPAHTKAADYGIPEYRFTTQAIPLRTPTGVYGIIPRKMSGVTCDNCPMAHEQCELMLRVKGKWAAMPCEAPLMMEVDGSILPGKPDR